MTGNNFGGGGFMDDHNNSASKIADKKVSSSFKLIAVIFLRNS